MGLCQKELSFPINQTSGLISRYIYSVILVHWRVARLNFGTIKSWGHLEVIFAVAKTDINSKDFCISQASYFNQVLNLLEGPYANYQWSRWPMVPQIQNLQSSDQKSYHYNSSYQCFKMQDLNFEEIQHF